MNPQRQKKITLLVFLGLVITLVTGLVFYALGENISFFYTPTQIKSGEAPLNQLIRVGGFVKKGSIQHKKGSLALSFQLETQGQSVLVRYSGLLPDLFREGQGIVTQGKLINSKVFEAIEVLAKHDANYKPPELENRTKNT